MPEKFDFSKIENRSNYDLIAEAWDREAKDKGIWHQRHDIDPVVFELLGDVSGKSILEVGCGNGYLSRQMALKGASVQAFDNSAKFIELARQREQKLKSGVEYFILDASKPLSFKKGSFDFVVANMCLMDIADINKTVLEIARVLKKDGKFIFSLAHPVFLFYSQKWVVVEEGSRKFYAKAIHKYSSPQKIDSKLGEIFTIQYRRSVGMYMKSLFNVGFFVSDFREITTSRPLKKTNDEGDSEWSKYLTEEEKKMKKFAQREIPAFLILKAVKH